MMNKAVLVALVMSAICAVCNAQGGATGGSGTCDPALLAGPAWDVSCPNGDNPANVTQFCVVTCKAGLTGPARERQCLFRNEAFWSGENPECKDAVDACQSFPCGVNATCRDLLPPAGNDTAGRSCVCDFGFYGDPEVLCSVNASQPCGGGLWSPSGFAPCQPCRTCPQGHVPTAACTATTNTQCPPRVDCGYIQGDPHFQSLDGAYYDYQGAGEFYALRGINDPTINVQVKFIPCSVGVTCMEGLSMRIGNVNMSVTYVSNTSPRSLRWFQNNVDVTSSIPLTINGVKFELGTNGYGAQQYIITDDAHATSITINDWYYIAATICVSSSMYDQIVGLMGRYDGNPANDNPNGNAQMGFGFEVLADDEDSWRVPEEASTTHYGVNQSYASINDPDFPAIVFDENFEPSDAATAACTGKGLTGEFLQACLQDVTTTGDVGFAAAAQGFSQLVVALQNGGGSSSTGGSGNGDSSSAAVAAVSMLSAALFAAIAIAIATAL